MQTIVPPQFEKNPFLCMLPRDKPPGVYGTRTSHGKTPLYGFGWLRTWSAISRAPRDTEYGTPDNCMDYCQKTWFEKYRPKFNDATCPYLWFGHGTFYFFMSLNVHPEAVEQVTTSDEILDAYREMMGIEEGEEATLMWYRLPLNWKKAKRRAMKASARKAKLEKKTSKAS